MGKIRKKIVVLVLSIDEDPWWSIENDGIRTTWNTDTNSDIEVLFYYGGITEKITGDRLFFQCPEGYSNIGYKTLEAFKYVVDNYDFDFIFRTNTSSYVNKVNLVRHCSSFDPNVELYSGVRCVPPVNDPRPIFASGCGYTLSKTTVSTVLGMEKEWDHGIIDDLALAKLMITAGVPVTHAPRYDINHVSKCPMFTELEASSHFHVRCKSEVDRVRKNDVLIMRHVQKVYDRLQKGGYRG